MCPEIYIVLLNFWITQRSLYFNVYCWYESNFPFGPESSSRTGISLSVSTGYLVHFRYQVGFLISVINGYSINPGLFSQISGIPWIPLIEKRVKLSINCHQCSTNQFINNHQYSTMFNNHQCSSMFYHQYKLTSASGKLQREKMRILYDIKIYKIQKMKLQNYK